MYLINNKNIKSYSVGKVAVPSAMKEAQQAMNTRRYLVMVTCWLLFVSVNTSILTTVGKVAMPSAIDTAQ